MSSSNQPSQAPTPNQTTSPQDDEQIGLSSFGEPPHDRDLTAINSVDSEIVRLLSTNKQTNSVLAGLTGGAKRVFEWFKGFISKVSWNGIKEGCNEIIGRFNWEDILNWFKGISSKIDWHDILEWFKKKHVKDMLRASGLTFGAVIALIMALGFGAQGIVGGSLAATLQSILYGGYTPAGGLFAGLQSMGMVGTLLPAGVGIASGAAAIAALLTWLRARGGEEGQELEHEHEE